MENKNDVKGGLVIDQLKRYAKRLSDYTGDSASVKIEIWYHRHDTGNYFDVELNAWFSRDNKRLEPAYETEDIRELGKLIDEFIEHDTKQKGE